MDEELPGQVQLGFVILGNDQQAAGIHVDPVHQHTHPVVLRVRPLGQAQVESQSIDQRAREMPVARMDHHPGRFVHNQEIFILVDDIERNVFRQDLEAAPFIRHDKADDIAGTDD